jgi:quercetin dioxygenase-like cupin family protein
MKTIHISPEQMATRVARFDDLNPLPVQQDPSVPQEAKDMIYARKLLPVIGLEGGAKTPISEATPIKGAAGMTMTLAVCPPGQGPGLHAHRKTYETFTVLKGRFEFSWGDEGEESVVLDAFDVISLPPGVCRAFRNVGDEEGVLQVVISGGVHDMNDIDVPPAIGEQIEALSPQFREKLGDSGITFTAGVEGTD